MREHIPWQADKKDLYQEKPEPGERDFGFSFHQFYLRMSGNRSKIETAIQLLRLI